MEKIKDVKQMLERAAGQEQKSAKEYNQRANESLAHADSISKQRFESLMTKEEHFDRFDTERKNIEMFGANYLAVQSMKRGR